MSDEVVAHLTAEQFAALLGSVDEAVLGIDAAGCITFATRPVADLTGEDPAVFVGAAAADVVVRPAAVDPSVDGGWAPGAMVTPSGATTAVEVVEVSPFGPMGETCRLLLLRSAGRRGEIEDELRRRIAHEEHLERLAGTFVGVTTERFRDGVASALAGLGEYLGTDRVSVWRPDAVGDRLVATDVWSRPGAPPPEIGRIGAAGSEMIARLRRGEVVRLDRVDRLGDTWSVERTLLDRRGIRSIVAAPMVVEGVFGGFVSAVHHRDGACLDGRQAILLRSAAGILAEAFARDEAERELLVRARHDPLTGLANRWAAIDHLRDALDRRATSGGVAVLLFDLDRFKALNDALGHAVGDQLLRAVAARLRSAATSEVLVARLGGDELLVVGEGIGDAAAALGLARELQMSIVAPFAIDGHDVFVTASVGCVHAARGGPDLPGPEELLGRADAAMYGAKARGRNRIELFDEQMLAAADDRLRIERELRHALDADQLEVHYQPERSLATGDIVALEAFVRWRHPVAGLLPAEAFVPVAAESDLVVDVGHRVRRVVCADLGRRRRDGLESPVVRINVSARELADADFVADVVASLDAEGLEPSAIAVEVSETALMAEPVVATEVLTALDALGVRTAIDGFGIGHSSLAHLAQLPVEAIGVDRSFVPGLVDDAGGDGGDRAIVAAMIDVARALGRRVRVAGVETEAQLDVLRRLGCDTVQGYHLGVPAPGD